MKKLFGLFLVLALGLSSCSKEDKDDDFDPLFSLPYEPLKNLTELRGKKYKYAGIKVEGRKAGILSEYAMTCSVSDLLVFSEGEGDEISKIEFFRAKSNCDGTDRIGFYDYKLIEEGLLSTRLILHFPNTEVLQGAAAVGEHFVDGRFHIQIGFQGEYLRIEDRISNYIRVKPEEEVFLYFKEYKY